MFDIGFSEILVIFVLALVVLGPEKLPRVAAQVGRWIGRARSMARQFREQLEEEVQLEEARRIQPPSPSVPATPTPGPASTAHSQLPDSVAASAAAQGAASPATQGGPTPKNTPALPVDEQQPIYPDTYSHAHHTDSLGREIEPPDERQQDWVGGVSTASRPTPQAPPAPSIEPSSGSRDAAYAPPHERGT